MFRPIAAQNDRQGVHGTDWLLPSQPRERTGEPIQVLAQREGAPSRHADGRSTASHAEVVEREVGRRLLGIASINHACHRDRAARAPEPAHSCEAAKHEGAGLRHTELPSWASRQSNGDLSAARIMPCTGDSVNVAGKPRPLALGKVGSGSHSRISASSQGCGSSWRRQKRSSQK